MSKLLGYWRAQEDKANTDTSRIINTTKIYIKKKIVIAITIIQVLKSMTTYVSFRSHLHDFEINFPNPNAILILYNTRGYSSRCLVRDAGISLS